MQDSITVTRFVCYSLW